MLHDAEQADPSLEAEGPLRRLPQAEGAPQRQLGGGEAHADRRRAHRRAHARRQHEGAWLAARLRRGTQPMRHPHRHVFEELGQVGRGAAGSCAVAAPAAAALRSLGQRAGRHGGGCSEIK